jgi:Raf kinase inhibitor-like YbhB/YbcL family protein
MRPGLERTIGRLLRPIRAGDRYLAWNAPGIDGVPDRIRLVSPAFNDNGTIPTRYAGAGVGENVSPPLSWSDMPKETAELVLIMQDPDAPLLRPVVHLIALSIAPDRDEIEEDHLSSPPEGQEIRFGQGLYGRTGYAGPRPVRGHGPHRYVFQIFALKERISLPAKPGIDAVLAGMGGSVLARGRLTGLYERV